MAEITPARIARISQGHTSPIAARSQYRRRRAARDAGAAQRGGVRQADAESPPHVRLARKAFAPERQTSASPIWTSLRSSNAAAKSGPTPCTATAS